MARRLADAGVVGAIVPDLPVDEAGEWLSEAAEAGIENRALGCADDHRRAIADDDLCREPRLCLCSRSARRHRRARRPCGEFARDRAAREGGHRPPCPRRRRGLERRPGTRDLQRRGRCRRRFRIGAPTCSTAAAPTARRALSPSCARASTAAERTSFSSTRPQGAMGRAPPLRPSPNRSGTMAPWPMRSSRTCLAASTTRSSPSAETSTRISRWSTSSMRSRCSTSAAGPARSPASL